MIQTTVLNNCIIANRDNKNGSRSDHLTLVFLSSARENGSFYGPQTYFGCSKQFHGETREEAAHSECILHTRLGS